MIEPILQSIITPKPKIELSAIMSRWDDLRWAAIQSKFTDDNSDQADHYAAAMGVVLDYVKFIGKFPANIPILKEFVKIAPKDSKIPAADKARYERRKDSYTNGLDAVEAFFATEPEPPCEDFELLVRSFFDDSRARYWAVGTHRAKTIALGSIKDPDDPRGERLLSGVDDMHRYLAQWKAKDRFLRSNEKEGSLHDNLELVSEHLLKMTKNVEGSRCYLGFSEIDNKVAVGPSLTHRVIALTGFFGHGKSGILTSILYRLMLQGKRVLVIPLEFSVEDLWARVCWHHLKANPDLDLPGLQFWEANGNKVTDANKETMAELLRRVKADLPGHLDCYDRRIWQEIREIAESAKEPYDVIMVDYIGHLSWTGWGKDRREGINAIWHDAQSLTQNYKSGRGIVVISPLQVNKEGLEAAKKAEAGSPEWGIYPQTAIDTFTDAIRDIDLSIGIFSDGYLKESSKAKLSCHKARGCHFFPFIVQAHPVTRLFESTREDVVRQQTVVEKVKQKGYFAGGKRRSYPPAAEEEKPAAAAAPKKSREAEIEEVPA